MTRPASRSTRSTTSREQTKHEISQMILDFVQENPAAAEGWERFNDYRGCRVSFLDSLEFFQMHVGTLVALVGHRELSCFSPHFLHVRCTHLRDPFDDPFSSK